MANDKQSLLIFDELPFDPLLILIYVSSNKGLYSDAYPLQSIVIFSINCATINFQLYNSVDQVYQRRQKTQNK